MSTLATTHGALGAVLKRLAVDLLEKYNPWWSQQPRDEFGRWSKGFVTGAFSPVGGGKPGATQAAPYVGEPGTQSGLGGLSHGVGGWQEKPAPAIGAPAGSKNWTIPEQVAQQQQAAAIATAAAKKPKEKAPKIGGYAHPTDWKQTGPQGGSNPGGVFTDAAGKQHYVKFYANADQGKNEVLANAIYRQLGIAAPESRNVILDGKKAVESPMLEGVKPTAGPEDLKGPDVLAGFVADAFLANHDVAGLTYDNIVLDQHGKATRIDNGGAMFYRAQGKPKADGPFPFVDNDVPELDSMRDPAKAKQAGKIFQGLSDGEMAAQAKNLVAKLPDKKIAQMVAAAGFSGDDATKYIDTLKGRRDAIAQRFLSASEEPKQPTTAELASAGLNAPAPIEPATPPKQTPAVAAASDPDHPHPEMLAQDPGLKSYAVADTLNEWLNGSTAKAIAAAKKPKVLSKILASKLHYQPYAKSLASVAMAAGNSQAHVVQNKDGTYSVKSGVQAKPQDTPKAAPIGSAQMYAAVINALNDSNVQPVMKQDVLADWIWKGDSSAKMKEFEGNPAFAKGLLQQEYGSTGMAQAAAGLLERMTGTGVKFKDVGNDHIQLELEGEHGKGLASAMLPTMWPGAQQGLQNPDAVVGGSKLNDFTQLVFGSVPKSSSDAQAKIEMYASQGNTVLADWMKTYAEKKFGVATHENTPASKPSAPMDTVLHSQDEATKYAQQLANEHGQKFYVTQNEDEPNDWLVTNDEDWAEVGDTISPKESPKGTMGAGGKQNWALSQIDSADADAIPDDMYEAVIALKPGYSAEESHKAFQEIGANPGYLKTLKDIDYGTPAEAKYAASVLGYFTGKAWTPSDDSGGLKLEMTGEIGDNALSGETAEQLAANKPSGPNGKWTVGDLEANAGTAAQGGIPSDLWHAGIEHAGTPEEIKEAHVAFANSPKYLAHLKDTNYETIGDADNAAALLNQLTHASWQAKVSESDGGDDDLQYTVEMVEEGPPGSPNLDYKGIAQSLADKPPPLKYPNGKLNPLAVMQTKPNQKMVDLLTSKKAATKKFKSDIADMAKTPEGLNAILAANFSSYKLVSYAKDAVADATGHYTSYDAQYGAPAPGKWKHSKTYQVQVTNDTKEAVQAQSSGGYKSVTYAKHPFHGGTLPKQGAAYSGSSSKVVAKPKEPEPPPKPFESKAKQKFSSTDNLKALPGEHPNAAYASLDEKGAARVLPTGVTRDMALTADPEAQMSHLSQLESAGHEESKSWLSQHYTAMNDEPESPYVKDEKIWPGSTSHLPSPLQTPSQLISALHQKGAIRPKGVDDWMLYAADPEEQKSAIAQVKATQGTQSYAQSAAAWLDRFYQGRADAALPSDAHFHLPHELGAIAGAQGLPSHAHPTFATPAKPLPSVPSYPFKMGSPKMNLTIGPVGNQTSPTYATSKVPQPAGGDHLSVAPNAQYGHIVEQAGKRAADTIAKFAAQHTADYNAGKAPIDPIGDLPTEGVHADSRHAFQLTQESFPAMLQAARASLPSKEVLDGIAGSQESRAALRDLAASVAAPILAHYGVTSKDYATIATAISKWTGHTKGADPDETSGNTIRVLSNMLRGRRPDENTFRDGEFAQISAADARKFAKRIPAATFRALLAHKAVTQAMFERYCNADTGTATLERGIVPKVVGSMAGKAFTQAFYTNAESLGKVVQAHELSLAGHTISGRTANNFAGGGGILIRQVRPEEVWHGQFLSPSQSDTYNSEAEVFIASNGGGPKFTVGDAAARNQTGIGNYIVPSGGSLNPMTRNDFKVLSGLSKRRLKKMSALGLGDDQPLHIPSTPAEWYGPIPDGWEPTPEAIEAFRKMFTTPDGTFHFYPDCDPGLRDNPTCQLPRKPMKRTVP